MNFHFYCFNCVSWAAIPLPLPLPLPVVLLPRPQCVHIKKPSACQCVICVVVERGKHKVKHKLNINKKKRGRPQMLHNARDHCTMMKKERSERRFRNVDNGYCYRTGKSREWKVSAALSLSLTLAISLYACLRLHLGLKSCAINRNFSNKEGSLIVCAT